MCGWIVDRDVAGGTINSEVMCVFGTVNVVLCLSKLV